MRLLRGDLDWIVMKCLEKDRTRRYATASDLAADIQRHLRHDPVAAGPPSAAYRVRKFVRRNRGPVLGASLVTLTLLVGLIGTATFALREAQARAGQEAQRKLAERNASQARVAAAQAEIRSRRLEAALALATALLFDSSAWQTTLQELPWDRLERLNEKVSRSLSTLPRSTTIAEEARKGALLALVHIHAAESYKALEAIGRSATAWEAAWSEQTVGDLITLELLTLAAVRLSNIVADAQRQVAVNLLEDVHEIWEGLPYPAGFRAVGQVWVGEGLASAGERRRASEIAKRALKTLSVGRYESSTARAYQLLKNIDAGFNASAHVHTPGGRVGLGRVLTKLGRYAEAEALLLGAQETLAQTPTAPQRLVGRCLQGLVELYDAWHAVEPGKGYDAKATAWRAKLEEVATKPRSDEATKGEEPTQTQPASRPAAPAAPEAPSED